MAISPRKSAAYSAIRMKLTLKYGLLISLGVVVWTVTAHIVVPNAASRVHSVGASLVFNALEILGIYFGIRQHRRMDPAANFKSSVKTGVSIAFLYAVTASLFFVFVVMFAPQWLASTPGAADQPLWQTALGAFVGLSVGATFLGLIYSTVIAFFFSYRARDSR